MNPCVQTEEKKAIMRKFLEKGKESFKETLLDLVCSCKPKCRIDGKNHHSITDEDIDELIDGIMSVEHWWYSKQTARITCDAYCVDQARKIIKRDYPQRHTYEI